MVLHRKFQAVIAEMNTRHLEREAEITGAVVALLARQHVLLLGDPGTGKSRLIRDLARRVQGAKYFAKQLARDTKTEELFGMWDLPAMEQGLFKRAPGPRRLQDAHIAFIDEIGKAGSNIRNQLLLAMEEREFEDGDQVLRIPLMTMYAASNEMFTDDDETAGAVWDRFTLRYVVQPIKLPANFARVLALDDEDDTVSATVTLQELEQAQAEVRQVDLSQVNPVLEDLRRETEARKIAISVRRWKRVQRIIRAHAWLNGRTVASMEDLEVAAYALWVEPGQLAEIRSLLIGLANPLTKAAMDEQDKALEVYNKAMAPDVPEEKLTAVGMEANKKLRGSIKALEDLLAQAQAQGKDTTKIAAALETVRGWNKEVMARCLGM